MIYQKHIPQFPLNNYIDSIIFITGNNKGTGLPKTAMSLVFNLEDNFKLFIDENFHNHINYKKFWIAGLQTKPTHVESYGTSKMLVIQFKTLGSFLFLNDPLHHYTNNYVNLDDILNNEAETIWEQLKETNSLPKRFNILENFLLKKLFSNKLPHQKLTNTIDLLANHSSQLSINEICLKLNISRKHLNHITKEYVGISPKTLSSLIRLQATLRNISSTRIEKLTDIAYQSEYFDQAHFINDFKKFTNLKPSEYLKLVDSNQSLKIIPHFIPYIHW